MQKAYIVWNMTEHGDGYEFFGIYRSYQAAVARYNYVIRKRYGKMTEEEREEADMVNGDSIRITEFNKEQADEQI